MSELFDNDIDDEDLFNDDFFAAEDDDIDGQETVKYKVIIIDDEEEIHAVTTLALADFDFKGGELEFIHAYSGGHAKELFLKHPDIAVALLDVVMESDDAGLNLARWIRDEQRNDSVRIVLRTGQPGQAPERDVIRDYDINDYKAKTELTSQKLFTLMYTALRAHKHILMLENSKAGMEKVINATKRIIGKNGFYDFIQACLEQLMTLIDVKDSVVIAMQSRAISAKSEGIETICGTGIFANNFHCKTVNELPFSDLLIQSLAKKKPQYDDNQVLILCQNKFNIAVLYANGIKNLSEIDRNLVNIFAENVTIALENTTLNEQLRISQREVIYHLSEVIENRSFETGYHIKRVAKYSELLGKLYGLSSDECEVLLLASPLHDIGKVGIPDAILNKPGRLDADEREIMEKHAELGANLLTGSHQNLLDAGSVIAGTHHERWDGTGYPNGLKGEGIPIFGRICALTDIFDALSSKRCYKEPWSDAQVLDYIKEQSGAFFDPDLVTLLVDNIEQFEVIKEDYKDPDQAE
jgi:response regulator RpfG family c-di-GMP phosphodiesterase